MNSLAGILTRPVLRTDLDNQKSGFAPLSEILLGIASDQLNRVNNDLTVQQCHHTLVFQVTLDDLRGMITALTDAEAHLVKLEAQLDASQLKLPL